MADEGIKVKIGGDSSELQRELQNGSKSAEQFSKDVQAAAKVSAAAGAAILAGLGMAVRASALETANIVKLKVAMDNVGLSYEKSEAKLESWIDSMQQATSYADDEQREALSNLVALTGDLTEAQELLTVGMDLARWKSLDLKTATDLLAKVYAGDMGTLKRYGIILDENTSSTAALAKIQELAAGQAEAYGETTAGQMDLIKNNLGDLGEAIGAVLEDDVNDAIKNINEIIQSIKNWTNENPELTSTLVKVAGGMGSVLLVGGSLIIVLPKLVKAINATRNAMIALKAITIALNPAMLAITAATAVVTGVIATLTWWVNEQKSKEEQLKRILDDVTATIEENTEKIKANQEQLVIENEKLEQLEQSLTDAQKALSDYRAEQDAALDSMIDASSKIELLNRLYDDNADAVHEAQNEVQGWKDRVADAEAEVKYWSEALEEANRVLQDAQNEFNIATDAVNELEYALQEVNNAIKDLASPRLEGMQEYEDKIHDVESELNKLELERLRMRQAGQDTSAIDAEIEALRLERDILRKEYDVAYQDKLYDLNRMAEEILGTNQEISYEDAVASLKALGIESSELSEDLQTALDDLKREESELAAAQSTVDTVTDSLETAQEGLDAATEGLTDAEATLATLEASIQATFDSIMGNSEEQSEILRTITDEIKNQQDIYDTIKNETLPGLAESIAKQEEIVAGLNRDIEKQGEVIDNLVSATEELLSLNSSLKDLFIFAGGTEEQYEALTGYASGGLIREPTLLTDIATGKPYGTMAEFEPEYIVPTDRMGTNIVFNNTFPNLSVRNDSDLLDIKRQLKQMESVVKDELRSGGQNG
ncbi:MAG: phage tail tape measure protein [Dehalococcoidales bacterium]